MAEIRKITYSCDRCRAEMEHLPALPVTLTVDVQPKRAPVNWSKPVLIGLPPAREQPIKWEHLCESCSALQMEWFYPASAQPDLSVAREAREFFAALLAQKGVYADTALAHMHALLGQPTPHKADPEVA